MAADGPLLELPMKRDPSIRAQLRDPDFFHEPVVPRRPIVDALTEVAAFIGSTIFTLWGILGWVFVIWLLAGMFS